MSTTTKTEIGKGLDPQVYTRILEEAYGPGAWHGNDIKAAIADVSEELAFWRPGPNRHSIAEIAVHHAFYVHSVRGRMSPAPIEPFPLEGDDWFALEARAPLTWPAIKSLVGTLHDKLAGFVAEAGSGKVTPKLTENERFELVLGITCHGAYHAGQVQLINALN